jgi:ribosome biogenesis GTPase / thiamine phosphate phosphatase
VTDNQATVIRTSRRWVVLLDNQGKQLEAKSSTKALEVTVGDLVTYTQEDSDLVIQQILPRKNTLERRNTVRSKVFATNVDRLYIVSCVGEMFNTAFIDRALVSATDQDIPVTIIINKIDQDEPIATEVEAYQKLNIPIIFTSVKNNSGIDQLHKSLQNSNDRIVAFCGLSGVGKSSLLNTLIPGSKRDVGEVSERRVVGKQTTTQAEAFAYQRKELADLQIIDLPGFSQFGMVHVPLERLNHAFSEFIESVYDCEFTNCSHNEELVCGVKKRVATGEIAQFRYQSYLEIRHEIECARSY